MSIKSQDMYHCKFMVENMGDKTNLVGISLMCCYYFALFTDYGGLDSQRRDDSDRDISDSGSESGGAFRPTARDLDHPSPNISLGPPLQPPMLPYLYPPNLYSGSPGLPPLGPPPTLPMSLFGPGATHASAASLPPSLLFNHLLQQQLFHGAYPLATPPVSLSSSIGPGKYTIPTTATTSPSTYASLFRLFQSEKKSE